jgi:sortase (surface protein transpeptidase)
MRPRTARLILLLSAVVLVAAGAAAIWWPRGEPRADLVAAGPVITTTTTTTTTTTAPAPTTVPTTTTTTTAPVQPSRLVIPAIGVDAPIVPVGLNPDGSMEVPAASDVGWYELGVAPGSPEGSAVLAAHVDYGGEKGAFYDLRSLPEGSEVLVGAPDGGQLRFVVDTRFQVNKDELPGEELFRSNGPSTLTLITCGGSFDRAARSYRDNIVLRAAPAT